MTRRRIRKHNDNRAVTFDIHSRMRKRKKTEVKTKTTKILREGTRRNPLDLGSAGQLAFLPLQRKIQGSDVSDVLFETHENLFETRFPTHNES